MKKSIKIFSLLLLLTGSTFAAMITPGDTDSEKMKAYSKSYPVSSSDKILLDNSFGEMKISTWDKNEIKVDVLITVKAGTDERAQKIMDMITIEDGKNGSEIFFKTHLKNDKGDGDDNYKKKKDHDNDDNYGKNTNFKINYTVYLPANTTLNATNQFGSLSIGDFDGVATLNSKFGSLTTGKLSQPKKLSIEFGKATIESMTNGKLSISFSRAQVNKLSGDVTINLEQANGIKLGLDNSLKKLDINNSFSTIYLDAQKDLSASFNIKSSFGSFSNKSEFAVNKNQEDEDRYMVTDKTYSGKAGSGSTPITIKSSFGHITLGHDLSFDVSNRARSKDKDDKDKTEKKRTRV
jgi:hypothetical protein